MQWHAGVEVTQKHHPYPGTGIHKVSVLFAFYAMETINAKSSRQAA